jgi:hypothetical protein
MEIYMVEWRVASKDSEKAAWREFYSAAHLAAYLVALWVFEMVVS